MKQMETELRKTGIKIIGDMPWGTHFCHFYETKDDLLDILIPYFKTGLENSEFCLWIVFEPLDVEEAKNALRQAIPEADQHLAAGDIEIFPHAQWYLKDGTFNPQWVTEGWQEKLDHALSRGYAGMRLNGIAVWLTEKDWKDFSEYEQEITKLVANQKMIALCSYPLEKSGAVEILDVALSHKFIIALRHSSWEMLESPVLKQVKDEIKRLNEELEQRVDERTAELAEKNEELRREIIERKRVEATQKESEQQYESLVNSIDGIIVEVDGQTLGATFVNKGAERILGYPVEQWLNEPTFWMTILHPEDRDWVVASKMHSAVKIEDRQLEYRMIAADGRVIWFRDLLTVNVTRDNSILLRGVKIDITDRKRIEENLKQNERQLAEAQQLARIGSWNWDIENNVVTWSDEIYRIFGLKPQEFGGTFEAYLDLVHPKDRDLIIKIAENPVGKNEPFSYYYRIIRPDGEVRILYNRRNIFTDEHKNIVRSFGTLQDVTERVQAEEQLKTSNEKLRALAAHLQSVREEESIRIARAIHDELGGTLTGLKMDISWLDKRLPEHGKEETHQKFKAMAELIDETIQKVRNISTELRPSILDDLGLAAAIEWQCREFQKRTEIKCRIITLYGEAKLSPDKRAAVFRIYQEILTNVARHSNAALVETSLEERDGNLILKVSDNGRGIKESDISDTTSLGLIGMYERAVVFGGKVKITGLEGKGTTVIVHIPLE